MADASDIPDESETRAPTPVIASEAKQSSGAFENAGLPRRLRLLAMTVV